MSFIKQILLKSVKLYKQILYLMKLSDQDIDRIVQMAWEDRTPFEAIEAQFGLPEKEVIALMRSQMKRSSFEMWRKRTNGRSTKHQALRDAKVDRFHCSQQRSISLNKIAKR
jgi:uncharacterized protein (TIGR03643 family)